MTKTKLRVQALVLRCLESGLKNGRKINLEDVCVGDTHCEPYYAAEVDGEVVVIEGDYARGVVRVRELDGRIGVEVSALIPAAVALHALQAWAVARAWPGAASNDDHGGEASTAPTTRPAPLSA